MRRTRRAFYEGVRAHADRTAGPRPVRLRGLRRRRPPGARTRLRGGGPVARLPASARPGGPARLLALGVDVARDRRHVPQARDGRRRLRGRTGAARSRRDCSRSRTSQTEAAASSRLRARRLRAARDGLEEDVAAAARRPAGSRPRRSARGRRSRSVSAGGRRRRGRPAPPGRRERKRLGDRRRLDRTRPPRRALRSSATRRSGDPAGGADDTPPATTSRRSQPRGSTSSWASAPCSRNHGFRCSRTSAASSSSAVEHRSTSRPQLPNRGLSTSGSSGTAAGSAGLMSVVCGCGRPASRSVRAVSSLSWATTRAAGRVPHVNAAGREPLELAGAAFDAVELLAHVEPGERNVSRLEERQRPTRLERAPRRDPRRGCGDERVIRRAAPVGDDGELHAEMVRRSGPRWGSIR